MAAAANAHVYFGDERDEILKDEEARDLLIAELAERAARAREDPVAFFEFVMREQTTRRPIKCVPHQKVGIEFMTHHDRSVNMWPIGTAKTYTLAGMSLFKMGQDNTLRGAVVSATQAQAAKIVSVCSDYIGDGSEDAHPSAELKLVFPNMRPSRRRKDKWTQTAITIDRPPGIPDATLLAVGIDGGLPGARLNWVIIDDLLNRENTNTKAQRDKVYTWLDSTVLNRLDPDNAWVVVNNTAWHPDDLVHRLEKMGWATLRMDVLGDIRVQDDAEWMRQGRKPWNSSELRPRSLHPNEDAYRLRAHDPDPKNEKPLWPERYSAHHIETVLRVIHLPVEFNRGYMLTCRDDGTSMCKAEYPERAKQMGIDAGYHRPVSLYRGPNPTFTGLDLAVSPGEENDETAFFTFEVLPDGVRKLLDIEFGQWPGPEILKKLFA
jgi:hypothetical protein